MSHTATGEWKSFEVRMQHRRAERLIARADLAAATGAMEEARASVEEARGLWPSVPGLTDVQHKIDARGVTTAKTDVPSRWPELAAATVAVALGAGAAGLLLVMAQPMTPPAPPPVTMAEALPSRDLTTLVDAISVVDRQTGANLQTANADQGSAIGGQASGIQDRGTIQAQGPGIRNQSVEIAPPAPVQTELPIASRTPPRPAIPDPPPPIPDLATNTTASPAMLAASKSATVQPPQQALIRSALARYAAAYTDLDVDAVEDVWPSVNRTALARAFASLESQRVSLGECRIEIDGNSAHASCDGSATWIPKIGGGAHTDQRSWSFELEKAPGGWQIVSTRVQNK